MSEYKLILKTVTDIKMHKFNGQEEEAQIKRLPIPERAERYAYRINGDSNANLAIPATWIYGAIVAAAAEMAGKLRKRAVLEVAPRVRIAPPMIDLGIKTYTIDITSAPAGRERGGTREILVKPRLDPGLIIHATLSTSLTETRVRDLLIYAGKNIGIGSDRKHGFGRFQVEQFEQINTTN